MHAAHLRDLPYRVQASPRGSARVVGPVPAPDPWCACRGRPASNRNQAARFGAAEAELAPVQHALPACQPRQQPKCHRQAVAHRRGKIAPIWRAAGHQPELGEMRRVQRGMAARELTAKAVSADEARKLRVVQIGQGVAGGQIICKQRAIAPIVLTRGAQLIAAAAAPLVQIHRDVEGREGMCEGLVMPRCHAQRGQSQQGGRWLRWRAANHLPSVSICSAGEQGIGLHAHALGAAPKWSSTSTSLWPGRWPRQMARAT